MKTPQLSDSDDRVLALEEFLEHVVPLLIAGSPHRAQIEALLHAWQQREPTDRIEQHLGDMAETVLRSLGEADTSG